ncbi:Dolichyl-diphosphooligosaccharide--protein glycotransferase [Aphelenchoides besseyi]|nr:Dolichyl-diphosphooligosaccharide--protein glycotransferase [Aphelenchoides besseyi]
MAEIGANVNVNLIAKDAKEKKNVAYASLLTFAILGLSSMVAFALRLFAVIRFESIIHEFDPWFNYRSTHYMVENGFYNFLNWFDERAWYPLGRIVGGTVFPGLMVTSGAIHAVLTAINFPIHIRDICVFLAPTFSSLTAISTYLLTKEIWSTGAGLFAACFIAIVPGYISRSVAGSYDNEGIAIFALQFTYYLWVRSVRTGSITWAVFTALSYFYMVAAWGGFIFITNLIGLHSLTLIIIGRYSSRLYVAYTTFYCIGQLLAMQIPFVGYQPTSTSEHMGAFGVFGIIQLVAFAQYVRSKLSEDQFQVILRSIVYVIASAIGLLFMAAIFFQKIAPFTGRFYSLLDPSYAKNNIPIIASVSEHQPTTWSSYYFDLQFLQLTDANVFVIIYALTSIYFSGVMVRLMLVLAPVMCIMAGIALSEFLNNFYRGINEDAKKVSYIVIGAVALLGMSYVQHCVWVTSEAYSSPSIVLAARGHGGSRIIFDDFREAYYWLRQNTDENAKVMSWWDYGYQISGMANRTVIVDNNTWNNTQISRVGQAMASNESHAYEIMREFDVDYVLVIFGGLTGYSSDDINKFLWMVRIGGSTPEGAHIHEQDYFTKNGEFRIDKGGSPTMLNSVMYRLCYHRFGGVYTEHGRPTGFDRVRHAEIGNKDFELKYMEEAYTTEHWIVRIYRVKKPNNRQ